MSNRRLGIAGAVAVALILPLALAACGRKGPLDPPPSNELPPPPAASPPAQRSYLDPLTPIGTAQQAQPAVAAQALPAPSQPAARTFILDPLIR